MIWESLRPFFQWCYDTGLARMIRDARWPVAIFETIHLLGLTVLLVTILAVSLRLAGLAMQQQTVTKVARDVAPFTAVALAVMVTTGVLMCLPQALKYWANPAFRFKITLLCLAIIFHFTLFRKMSRSDEGRFNRGWGKLTALLAIALWLGVAAAGRAISFF